MSSQALGKYGPANVEGTTESRATDNKDDEDIDPFGSDEEEESEEAKRLREEPLAQYESKKAKQTSLVAKSLAYQTRTFGMMRQIQCVVEDNEVGTDTLEEKITAFDENAQSMVMAAFHKIQNPLWITPGSTKRCTLFTRNLPGFCTCNRQGGLRLYPETAGKAWIRCRDSSRRSGRQTWSRRMRSKCLPSEA
ncbi:hypothetical protein Celaphus_00000856 [Cervus elaphus hippelaphus]|uniref:Elongation factor 1 beta central acidic region eukaryote domain-containing protein n=1 Tax=Cervus elaphus hippelaphus TaxID=46360 RepID=A0A212D7T3_CEREH|nr:hypothetical protein Celaphus_00000856 [Cervus elaphus hippelaphus]